MDFVLQIVGTALQAVGVALVFLQWRGKRSGALLAGGWGLILVGAIPWLLDVSIERGLAIAMLAPMLFGLALLAPDGLARLGANKRERKQRARQDDAVEAQNAAPGAVSRTVARWIGALVAAPALALAATAAWQVFAPGSMIDRVAFSVFTLMIVWIAALLWLLSSARPWAVTAAASVGALALGGGAYWFAASAGAA